MLTGLLQLGNPVALFAAGAPKPSSISDPFVLTAAGRTWFRLEDLIRLDNALTNWKG